MILLLIEKCSDRGTPQHHVKRHDSRSRHTISCATAKAYYQRYQRLRFSKIPKRRISLNVCCGDRHERTTKRKNELSVCVCVRVCLTLFPLSLSRTLSALSLSLSVSVCPRNRARARSKMAGACAGRSGTRICRGRMNLPHQ